MLQVFSRLGVAEFYLGIVDEEKDRWDAKKNFCPLNSTTPTLNYIYSYLNFSILYYFIYLYFSIFTIKKQKLIEMISFVIIIVFYRFFAKNY